MAPATASICSSFIESSSLPVQQRLPSVSIPALTAAAFAAEERAANYFATLSVKSIAFPIVCVYNCICYL
jgi:hypothetical protein